MARVCIVPVYSKSCESSRDAGKRLCFLGPPQDKNTFRDVRNEVISIFHIFFTRSKFVGCFNIPAKFDFSSGPRRGDIAHPRQ